MDAAMCAPARTCGDICCEVGNVCGGGRCCAPAELCGGECCGDSQQCVADRCVLSCADDEVPCGEGATAACCAAGQLCYLGACTEPGAPCASRFDCAEGEYCEATVGRCLPRDTSGEACEYIPETDEFMYEEEWSWTGDADVLPEYDQVMMAPMVANLTDDDGDGDIDADDIPDVVFSTFRGSNYRYDGIIRAIRGDGGARIWPTADPGYRVHPGAEVAIADVDPTSLGPEIIACGASATASADYYLLILAADGTLLRRFDTAPSIVSCGGAVAVGDMDRDGVPEIVAGSSVVHADGTVVTTRGSDSRYTALADLDGDGDLEGVGSARAFEMDGTTLWDRSADAPGLPAIPFGGYPAVADLNLDGLPEIVLVTSGEHSIRALDGATGSTIWGPIDINPTADPVVAAAIAAEMDLYPDRDAARGGGPPTIGNFDGDPEPEIAFAGGYAYAIFDADGTLKWHFVTQDRSSRATGSSLFDFEGDGVAEVLYNDELAFRVFRGTDGAVLRERCNTSGTLLEFPIVVDVDNDDHAEIVLMENDYAFRCDPPSRGIHVFGHPTNQWVRTRRIFNQHTYHVTNINEDGTVPREETPHWTQPRLNTFRQNVQPDGLFDAPDVVLVDLQAATRRCPTALDISVRVSNRGRSGAPAGIPVTLYEDAGAGPTPIGRVTTTRPLLPGESEVLTLAWPIPAGRERDLFVLSARANAPDDSPLVGFNECRTTNNDAGPLEVSCPTVE